MAKTKSFKRKKPLSPFGQPALTKQYKEPSSSVLKNVSVDGTWTPSQDLKKDYDLLNQAVALHDSFSLDSAIYTRAAQGCLALADVTGYDKLAAVHGSPKSVSRMMSMDPQSIVDQSLDVLNEIYKEFNQRLDERYDHHKAHAMDTDPRTGQQSALFHLKEIFQHLKQNENPDPKKRNDNHLLRTIENLRFSETQQEELDTIVDGQVDLMEASEKRKVLEEEFIDSKALAKEEKINKIELIFNKPELLLLKGGLNFTQDEQNNIANKVDTLSEEQEDIIEILTIDNPQDKLERILSRGKVNGNDVLFVGLDLSDEEKQNENLKFDDLNDEKKNKITEMSMSAQNKEDEKKRLDDYKKKTIDDGLNSLQPQNAAGNQEQTKREIFKKHIKDSKQKGICAIKLQIIKRDAIRATAENFDNFQHEKFNLIRMLHDARRYMTEDSARSRQNFSWTAGALSRLYIPIQYLQPAESREALYEQYKNLWAWDNKKEWWQNAGQRALVGLGTVVAPPLILAVAAVASLTVPVAAAADVARKATYPVWGLAQHALGKTRKQTYEKEASGMALHHYSETKAKYEEEFETFKAHWNSQWFEAEVAVPADVPADAGAKPGGPPPTPPSPTPKVFSIEEWWDMGKKLGLPPDVFEKNDQNKVKESFEKFFFEELICKNKERNDKFMEVLEKSNPNWKKEHQDSVESRLEVEERQIYQDVIRKEEEKAKKENRNPDQNQIRDNFYLEFFKRKEQIKKEEQFKIFSAAWEQHIKPKLEKARTNSNIPEHKDSPEDKEYSHFLDLMKPDGQAFEAFQENYFEIARQAYLQLSDKEGLDALKVVHGAAPVLVSLIPGGKDGWPTITVSDGSYLAAEQAWQELVDRYADPAHPFVFTDDSGQERQVVLGRKMVQKEVEEITKDKDGNEVKDKDGKPVTTKKMVTVEAQPSEIQFFDVSDTKKQRPLFRAQIPDEAIRRLVQDDYAKSLQSKSHQGTSVSVYNGLQHEQFESKKTRGLGRN